MDEQNCTIETMKSTINKVMNGDLENLILLVKKGKSPSNEVNESCCNSFYNYLYAMIQKSKS